MDKVQFPADDVTDVIKSVITEVFQQVQDVFPDIFAGKWATSIEEKVLWNLSKLDKPLKYMVTCSIMQKSGAGFQCVSSCYWNNATDGCCSVRWENYYIYCIVTVYGVAI